MKECFVGRRDHRSNETHESEEVSAAIKRLKEKHVTALLTVAHLDAILKLGEDGEDDREEVNEAQWEEEESDEDEVRMEMAHVANEELLVTERAFSNTAFVHGSPEDASQMVQGMYSQLNRNTEGKVKFDVIQIETCGNPWSIISEQQEGASSDESGEVQP